jgi:hypothetical protein
MLLPNCPLTYVTEHTVSQLSTDTLQLVHSSCQLDLSANIKQGLTRQVLLVRVV